MVRNSSLGFDLLCQYCNLASGSHCTESVPNIRMKDVLVADKLAAAAEAFAHLLLIDSVILKNVNKQKIMGF